MRRLTLIGLVVSLICLCGCQKEEDQEQPVSSSYVFHLDEGYVTLNSGYDMPTNGIGTYSLTGDECYKAITSALKSGVRLIDTAYMYHNEEEKLPLLRSNRHRLVSGRHSDKGTGQGTIRPYERCLPCLLQDAWH